MQILHPFAGSVQQYTEQLADPDGYRPGYCPQCHTKHPLIAHGLYSWVPPAVRNRLLQVCNEALSPQGVAFVSYNTYPGFYVRQILREIMLFHVHQAPDPKAMIEQALALSHLMASALTQTDEFDLS